MTTTPGFDPQDEFLRALRAYDGVYAAYTRAGSPAVGSLADRLNRAEDRVDAARTRLFRAGATRELVDALEDSVA